MNPPTLLTVIYADPAESGMPAEALRMAMGLGTGPRTLQMVLMGPAAKMLMDDVDDLVDGEMIENNLDVFEEWGTVFHVERAAISAHDISDPVVEVVPVETADVARMMAAAHQVLVF
ncbi:MAG: hypothetical protein ACE5FN_03835 [Leptospirillia bacterium]